MGWTNSLLSVRTLSDQTAMQTILGTNLVTLKYGLALAAQDVLEIFAARDAILRGRGRVDFGVDTLGYLITELAASGFITQDDYVTTIVDLLEVFYCLKNQSEDAVSDTALIFAMRSLFEGPCAGSVELLRDYELEDVLQASSLMTPRRVRRGVDEYGQ